jgi:hypothetical protein
MSAVSLLLALMVLVVGGECGLPAWPCYEIGMPVPILFEYAGEDEGWDGSIGWIEIGGKRSLSVANACFLVVTRGLGEFEPPTSGKTVHVSSWRHNPPPRGELVPPVGEAPQGIWYQVRVAGPFATLVDLSEIYQLDHPGVYTVYWGHNWESGIQCETEIMFEILPKRALKRAAAKVEKMLSEEG